MSQFEPLLALGAQEIISIIVFAIVVLSSIISQFLSKQREQQKAERRPQRGPLQGGPMDDIRAGVPQQGRPQGQKPAALEDEIGEFLRRAARGGGRRPPQAQPPRQTQQPQPQRPMQARPRAPVPRRAQPPLAAEIVEPARPPVGQGLSEQVARDISTADIARHTNQLGSETRQATAKLDKRIHKKFDHQLGNLEQDAVVESAELAETREPGLPITSAAGLSALLSDTESLKQAIILSEILQRPAHRW